MEERNAKSEYPPPHPCTHLLQVRRRRLAHVLRDEALQLLGPLLQLGRPRALEQRHVEAGPRHGRRDGHGRRVQQPLAPALAGRHGQLLGGLPELQGGLEHLALVLRARVAGVEVLCRLLHALVEHEGVHLP